MSETGHLITRSAVYRSECCGYEVDLKKGDRFPFCGVCHRTTRWILIYVTPSS